MDWFKENADWFFSGVGVALLSCIGFILRRFLSSSEASQSQKVSNNSHAIQAGRDVKIDKK